ncbi:MAG TPA: tetratricopeptide repeat-containing diguanylate cyclase [Longimicrobium sp.]|nr:tetratricopeptide repeat-containing diguanylate cyclase [Longimicrobium sp.]
MRIRILPAVLLLGLLSRAPLSAQPAAQNGRTLFEQAERLQAAGDEAALPTVERALALLRAPADRPVRMKALGLRCWLLLRTADPDSLVAVASAGVAEAERAGDARTQADLRLCRGYAHESAGRMNEATAEYEIGVAQGRRLRDAQLLADALILRGELRYYRGEMGGALADLTESHDLYVRLKKPTSERRALNAIANLYADRRVGEYDKALEYYRQLLAIHQAAGSTAQISTTYFNLGTTLESKGDPAAALEYYRRSLALERQRGDSSEIATVERSIGIALTKTARPAEALPWLDAALAYYVRTADVDGQARARLSRGTALRAAGRPADALADLEAARVHFDSTGNTRFLEKLHDERALAFAATGDWRGAYEARGTQLRLQQALAEQLKEEHTSRLRVQFDTEKKEAENRALTLENRLRGQRLATVARIRRLQTVIIALSVVIMGILAVLVGRHVQSERLLRTMAMTDELTRLPNRRHLLAVAHERLVDAKRSEKPVSILALDVDHFKRINDTFGHEAGDVVLRRVAQTCRAALRHDDVIGRTGGEEFVVVLPHADAGRAMEIAERLRAAVEALDWAEVDPALRVTVSVGVAERAPADDDFAALSRRADDSLYRAKERGRNRVDLAPA